MKHFKELFFEKIHYFHEKQKLNNTYQNYKFCFEVSTSNKNDKNLFISY